MSSTPARRPSRWPLILLGIVTALLGLALAVGGAWLLILGGSWYYLPAGIGLLVAGVQLARDRMSGAWWFAAVFVGTLLWTAWESGLDYWRWVPRFGLIVALGIVLALLLPRLSGGPSRRVSRVVAAALGVVFIAAFALAFVPYGVTRGKSSAPQATAGTVAPKTAAGTFVQAKDAPADDDWAAYGRSNAAMRYSPLAQIDRDNVKQLQRAWTFRTGDLPEHRWGAETTPLKVGDTLYLCTARNRLIALDARNGKQRWRYDPKVPDSAIPYTAACRGVAYYALPADAVAATANAAADSDAALPANAAAIAAQGCPTRIIEGTLDGRLIAVDARTGQPCAGFGNNGAIDIKVGMGSTPPGMVSITSAPTIVRDVIVTGHQVLDGQRRDAPSGVIKGFDAVTGELRWAWDMARPETTGLPPPGQTYTRGTPNMWTTATGDEQLGLVYLPMGNSAADYWSGSRTAPENRYSTSLVALDVTTGKPAWHFQSVHKDVWDYDLGSQATLVDFPTAGGAVPALVLPSKQGDMYVLDRRSGKSLTPVEERPVPQGGVEPEQRSPTQPFSSYHTLRKPDLTERDMWGISPVDQMICRIQFRRASYQGFYTPPTSDTHSIEYPGYNGGSDWGGIAVDPRRGIIVANYNDMPNHNRLVPRAEADRLGWAPRDEVRGDIGGAEGAGDPQVGTPYAIDVNAGWRQPFTGLLCKQPPYGGIRAIDLRTGQTLWDRPFGTARANGPMGIASHLPIHIGTPNNGGSAVTAGGLVFIAAATDNLIRAIDIDTGETLWQDVLPAGGQANPMVYAIDGREYLVIMAGGHHFMETPIGDYVIAYALPQ
ncbi:quinoprotein glucose dehydrogenase [Luteimonas cucumeris]|uniref:Quinoprotein glucose dehydrogenase n=1 Tax=Luteimonas cucumeris TaxID=985012 RepID=A0A562LE61_9GAMM|nr:membrane-bound PQQ-dependent dehydrogenase, glucose/quinate/shikimate family [Luteimonas cucumeris]TWI05908.1 quinoprotein glucose dehydrogenase [Luteimonas cucumeris]